MDNIDQEIVRVAELYLYAVAAGMPTFALFNILRGYWEGLGNTVPTSVFGFIALLLNIPLNWIFIFGHFGMPALGGVGCGVATSITMYLCAVFGESLDELANRQRARIWLPLVGSHSGGIVS